MDIVECSILRNSDMNARSPRGDRLHWRSRSLEAFGTRTAAAIAALAAVFVVATTAAFANPSPPLVAETIQSLGEATPTSAWIRFCERHPNECDIDVSEPARITLDENSWRAVVEVNRRANAMILPVTDQDHWGVLDRWDYPDDGMGDCEDIQLLKRRLLVETGLPQRALRMAVVLDEKGEGHAVLMVLTDHGDFILDNKRNEVLPWQETGYVYHKREGTNSSAWVALGDRSGPVITANR